MSEEKIIFIVWTNTDLTEGRGGQVPIAYCEQKATAIRIAKGKGVQGSNAEVQPFSAVKHNNNWCAPICIQRPSEKDIADQKLLDEKAAVLEKARAAGLSDSDLKILTGQ